MTIAKIMASEDLSFEEGMQGDGYLKALVRADNLGEISFINKALLYILGDCHTKSEKPRIQDIVHLDKAKQSRFEKILEITVELGQKSTFIQDLLDKDGEDIPMRVCTAPLFSADNCCDHILVVFEYYFPHMDRNLDGFLRPSPAHRSEHNLFDHSIFVPGHARSIPASLGSRPHSIGTCPSALPRPCSSLPLSEDDTDSACEQPPRWYGGSPPSLLRARQLKAGKALRDAILFSGASQAPTHDADASAVAARPPSPPPSPLDPSATAALASPACSACARAAAAAAAGRWRTAAEEDLAESEEARPGRPMARGEAERGRAERPGAARRGRERGRSPAPPRRRSSSGAAASRDPGFD
jgi:hypothetical protein